jgi:hypothetical protein
VPELGTFTTLIVRLDERFTPSAKNATPTWPFWSNLTLKTRQSSTVVDAGRPSALVSRSAHRAPVFCLNTLAPQPAPSTYTSGSRSASLSTIGFEAVPSGRIVPPPRSYSFWTRASQAAVSSPDPDAWKMTWVLSAFTASYRCVYGSIRAPETTRSYEPSSTQPSMRPSASVVSGFGSVVVPVGPA